MTPIDISLPIKKNMPLWPDAPAPDVLRYQSISEGNPSNNSMLSMELHTGTHFDAPLHFLPTGGSTEDCDLMAFIGKCYVADMSGTRVITGEVLELADIPLTERLLIKTDNSALYAQHLFCESYAALDEDGAQWIISRGIRLAGMDYLSMEIFQNSDFPAHKLLLSHNVVILEGLNLGEAREGWYTLLSLPLKIYGAEASPVRAILLPLEFMHV